MKAAVCACGAIFYDTNIEEMSNHIVENSSKSHYWTYVADIVVTKELPWTTPDKDLTSTVPFAAGASTRSSN